MTGGITVVVGFLLLVFFILTLIPMWRGGGLGDETWLFLRGLISLGLMGGGLLALILGGTEIWENRKKNQNGSETGAGETPSPSKEEATEESPSTSAEAGSSPGSEDSSPQETGSTASSEAEA